MLILPAIRIDRDSLLARFFVPYQIHWIQAEDVIHARGKQVFALGEKSVRIGWTFGDEFKNVRKRLRFSRRDYLFATKDYPSALEFAKGCMQMIELFNAARYIISYGEECHKVPRIDPEGRPSGFTDEVKMGVIKFDNGSCIRAFSSNPQAMAVYGGDVGLDEFAKHTNARLLWETAQGRVTWNYDMAVWSSHDGEDTLFNQFVQQARADAHLNLQRILLNSSTTSDSRNTEHEPRPTLSNDSTIQRCNDSTIPSSLTPNSNLLSPWNLYYRVTLPDAIELGLLDVINRVHGTNTTADEFIANCQARSGLEEVYQQTYMCNPMGASTNHIVEWSAIERCRYDYQIIRVHFEHAQIIEQFGEFSVANEINRHHAITDFIHKRFLPLFQNAPLSHQTSSSPSSSSPDTRHSSLSFRLGFEVAASGQGHLAVIYIDQAKGDELWLRALLTFRTEDWDFLQTVLFKFLRELRHVQAAGDSSGLGKQICWEAQQHFRGRFISVNFSSKKHDMGFALMNQLSVAQKRFPAGEQDIAADYFALRKSFQGNRWIFSESRNHLNLASHCDIAWAGALATHVHTERRHSAGGAVLI